MKMPEAPSSVIARRELEESWRQKVEEAHSRYHAAAAWHKELLQDQPDGESHCQDGPLGVAQRAESEALAEYTRLLKVFTELTVHDHLPQ
jgi:hypothetical protein